MKLQSLILAHSISVRVVLSIFVCFISIDVENGPRFIQTLFFVFFFAAVLIQPMTDFGIKFSVIVSLLVWELALFKLIAWFLERKNRRENA